MTMLEQLVTETVRQSVLTTISRTTSLVAEEMAREILGDAQFRRDLQTLIRQAMKQTITDMTTTQS